MSCATDSLFGVGGVFAEPSQDGEECFGLTLLEGSSVWAVDNDELVLDVEWFGSSAAVDRWGSRCFQVDAYFAQDSEVISARIT